MFAELVYRKSSKSLYSQKTTLYNRITQSLKTHAHSKGMHALDLLHKDYRRYRWFFTRSGKLVIGGKSASQNDELLHQITALPDDYLVMHTAAPGSPFCVLLTPFYAIKKADREECAIFTGCLSRAWKEKKAETHVDVFLSSQLVKEKGMKAGTWSVKTTLERLTVPLKLALTLQHGIVRAVPPPTVSKKDTLAIICPGTLDKNDLATKLAFESSKQFTKEELLAALPAGGSKLCPR